MTKKTEADELLRMSNDWQWRLPTWGKPDVWPIDSCALDPASFDAGASCALSEVAGMGFDIVNADGSACEKVAVMFRAILEPAPTGHAFGYFSNLRRANGRANGQRGS